MKSGFAISAAGLEQLAAGKEKPSGQTRINNQQQFRSNVCGGLIVMGGLGAARYTCHSDGGDTSFKPKTSAGSWVVYQNGQQIPAVILREITMPYIAEYFECVLNG